MVGHQVLVLSIEVRILVPQQLRYTYIMENYTARHETCPPLRFAPLAPDVWEALQNLKRTGWVDWGVQNPESVQEHTISLRNLAASIDELSIEERDGLLDMLEVHDWPEAIHGDEVILSMDEEELRSLKATKFEKEQIALVSICEKLGERGQEIMSLWLRFETSSDKAAMFARQLDKYQAVEQALIYEKSQGIDGLFMEFFTYERARNIIQHPILLEKMNLLEKDFDQYKTVGK
jgi:putative hydrolases of HD superfamily